MDYVSSSRVQNTELVIVVVMITAKVVEAISKGPVTILGCQIIAVLRKKTGYGLTHCLESPQILITKSSLE